MVAHRIETSERKKSCISFPMISLWFQKKLRFEINQSVYVIVFFSIGPSLISKFRPDLQKKYENVFGEGDTRVLDYIYHLNAQYPRYENYRLR